MSEKVELSMPVSWQEVTKEQLGIIASLMNEQLTREETLFVLFCRFTGIKHEGRGVFVTSQGQRIRMEAWQLRDFCGRLSYIMDEKPCDIVNPTKVNSYLDDISFGAYVHADSLMYGYLMKGDPKLVQKALRDLGDRSWWMSKQRATEILLWWTGVQQWLKGQYPDVFATKDGDADGYDPLTARQNIMLLLNDDNPQDNTDIEESKMHDVLAALQHKIEHAKMLQEQKPQGAKP